MSTGICFACGKRLVDGLGGPIVPVERDHHGNPIKLHKTCAKSYDRERPVTARATTTEGGGTFVDERIVGLDGVPARLVWKRSVDHDD